MLQRSFILFCIIFTFTVYQAQLKNIEIKQIPAEQTIPLFPNHPDKAALIVYSSLETLSFRSNTGGIVSKSSANGKFVLILEPETQSISVMSTGFIEGRIMIRNPKPKEVFYYSVMPVEDDKNSIPVNIITEPRNAVIIIDGITYPEGKPISLLSGSHSLVIRKPGYKKVEEMLSVSRESNLFRFELKVQERSIFRVISDPAGARVFIDNIPMGITPYEEYRLPGKHLLRLMLPNFENYEDSVTIGEDPETLINVPLSSSLGSISISVNPPGALLTINNEEITPGSHSKPEGTYIISISEVGYEPKTDTLYLKKGEKVSKDYRLNSLYGRLLVSVVPEDATIKIDGRISNRTNEYSLLEGSHEINLSREGYEPSTDFVQVIRGATERYSKSLRRLTGSLLVSVNPSGAEIELKKERELIDTWKGLRQLSDIPVGEYQITARYDGAEAVTKDLIIEDNKETVVNLLLETVPLLTESSEGGGFGWYIYAGGAVLIGAVVAVLTMTSTSEETPAALPNPPGRPEL